MKTRVTVLNENIDAKYRWPGYARLVRAEDNRGGYGLCCIGCEGLTRGLDPEDANDYKMELPSSAVLAVPEWEEGAMWHKSWPSELLNKAVEINDNIAFNLKAGKATREDVDYAVKKLRGIFKEVGEANGEKWIIRHLKDDRMFEYMVEVDIYD